ncbi:hypothetical protein [Nocardia sp.]|uniref:hypothetical protein n=1 Tax=Nocardia sp. TaxID=1821 RepID=UPI0026145DC7|nr:hypothetical protein [Nocardia sp.]
MSASENIDFSAIRTHTILLPHGLGFNKMVPRKTGSRLRLAGLPPAKVIQAGAVTITLSHPEQRAQLSDLIPAIAARTAIVGDPTFDRLRASRDLRTRYRDAFGTGDRTLVVVASTWGRDSVIGRWPSLPARLLAALPADSYQVAVVLHPNIWTYYGRFQIESWLSEALNAGLVLVGPESGWHAALIAADQVISDHGSLALFTAGLDIPLLLAGSTVETVAGTPIDALTAAAEFLCPDGDLRQQVDDARKRHMPGQYEHITDRVFGHHGDAGLNVQRLIYGRLGITPLNRSSSLSRIPVPDIRVRAITAFVAGTAEIRDATLSIERVPAAVWHHRDHSEYGDFHVVAAESERDPRILERAAVITSDLLHDPAAAIVWAEAMLAHYPGARIAVAATRFGCIAVSRNGTAVEARAHDADSGYRQVIASAIYCYLITSDHSDLDVTIRVGATAIAVSFKVSRRDGPVAR